jgi:hypothetical protein
VLTFDQRSVRHDAVPHPDSDQHPDSDHRRADDLHDHLEALRIRTTELRTRAIAVAERAREVRSSGGATCNHGAEVQELQVTLAEVAKELDGLRTAMQTRAVIEQAKGMLMAERKIDADEAFALLVNLSQTTHRKLVQVATVLVDTWRVSEHGAP